MITDLLTVVSFIDRHQSGETDIDAAAETAVEYVDRDVLGEEQRELQETLESGWLE
jgi:hypothetical protein